MSLNINSKITDNFYRYKMDKIKTSQTGRGGNCHTILDNLDSISIQINTVPDLLLQYIGNISGCNTKKDNGYILKGHYDTDKIQEIIYNFINFATLCKKCTIPELSPKVINDGKKKFLISVCFSKNLPLSILLSSLSINCLVGKWNWYLSFRFALLIMI